MATGSFDFAPLLSAGLPPAAARWTGLAKYSFVGGNNDPDQVPVDGLVEAAKAVLTREGRTLATYGLASGPQGYRPLREFLVGKLKRDADIACSADEILIVSGSLQALDLVNATLLTRAWYRERLAVPFAPQPGPDTSVEQAEQLLAHGPLFVDDAQRTILGTLPNYPLGIMRRVLPRDRIRVRSHLSEPRKRLLSQPRNRSSNVFV